jgi:hypothetical protein
LLLEPTEMCMANVCLKEMGPNVFFLCVWDYGGCRSVRSRNMQKPNLRIVTVTWSSQLKFQGTFPFFKGKQEKKRLKCAGRLGEQKLATVGSSCRFGTRHLTLLRKKSPKVAKNEFHIRIKLVVLLCAVWTGWKKL